MPSLGLVQDLEPPAFCLLQKKAGYLFPARLVTPLLLFGVKMNRNIDVFYAKNWGDLLSAQKMFFVAMALPCYIII